jgi:inosose dehydratase
MVTRREFLETIGAAVATADLVSGFSRTVEAAVAGSDVALAEQAPGRSGQMRFGYAAITWGADIVKAMDDISAVGFRAIQLRGEAFAQYGERPRELRALLEQRNLTFAVLSSGNLSIDPAREQEMMALHLQHARFVRDCGGLFLQVIDERPKGRAVAGDDYRRLGRLMTELGKRTADVGVPLVYHHHMNSTGEKPQEVRAVLDAADPRHVRLLFDVAHYQQGGGDPVAAIREYRQWIEVIHLKDVRDTPRGTASYEFVELGRGRVDLPGVFAALRDIAFDKWAIVELDRVPDPGGSPKASAEMNKRYLIERVHQSV